MLNWSFNKSFLGGQSHIFNLFEICKYYEDLSNIWSDSMTEVPFFPLLLTVKKTNNTVFNVDLKNAQKIHNVASV